MKLKVNFVATHTLPRDIKFKDREEMRHFH